MSAGRPRVLLNRWLTPMDDSVSVEMDEGFIDDNSQTPSISENLSTVGDGADEEMAQQEEV